MKTDSDSRAASAALWERWSDGVVVALLAGSSVLAAWSGYQSALWGGEQATAYSQAGSRRVESVRTSTTAYQLRPVDFAVFLSWLDAFAAQDSELSEFIEQRFSTRLAPAFEAWVATTPRTNPDAPPFRASRPSTTCLSSRPRTN